MYDASVSARTSAAVGEAVVNPIDFEEVADVNVAKSIDADSYSHIPCFGDFIREFPNDSNRVHLPGVVKRSAKRKPTLRCIIYCICKKRLRK